MARRQLCIEQSLLFRSPIGCSAILLSGVHHQPQLPVLVNGQRGVLEGFALPSIMSLHTPLQAA